MKGRLAEIFNKISKTKIIVKVVTNKYFFVFLAFILPFLFYFDIFFDELAKIASEEHEYRPISRFPSAVRDIAVLVPRFIKVEDV